MQNLDEPIKGVGIPEVAKACGVSERAVYKWLKNGFLPKTEFFWENEIRLKNRRDFWWQISSKRNA
ncbi:regulatory protein from bacteriophage origin [Escherichia fergusonii]|nr:regulatory protein from bacteriophage origin [Escherichia fergusonii]